MSSFPVFRSDDKVMEFLPSPYEGAVPPFAVLVMAWRRGEVLICDIAGRGWTVPSGRIEAGETEEDAALRELREEAGAEVSDLRRLGTFRIDEGGCESSAVVFSCVVESLGPIASPQESRSCRFANLDELPRIYSFWNPLTEAVFTAARQAHR